MTDIDAIKKTARKAAGDVRKVASKMLPDAGTHLCDHVLVWLDRTGVTEGPKIVSGYWPMGSEIDPVPSMEALLACGHDTCLPVVEAPETPLIFRRWRPGDTLVPGGFGTSVPPPDADDVIPDILMVPMLSFDRAGYRLGYGGGFYDRTIATLTAIKPITTLGVAYSAQRVDTVPIGEFDVPLDAIISETGVVGGNRTKETS